MILNFKKLRKLRTNPKLFFKDAIRKKFFLLNNIYKKYLPKKYKGSARYAIISAVYNVEKYLDDYFNSIINQRLDFEKNIFMILVDDGSIDNSANIIKKYQKEYPKNIVYLYKENGGQASARNLGLKYMQENNYKTSWVTFTDPDDFLDRNFFYEVDRLIKKNKDLCLIRSKVINFFEENKIFKKHVLCDALFRNTSIKKVFDLNKEVPSGNTSIFLSKLIEQYNITFPESIEARANFEDVRFAYEYLLNALEYQAAVLPSAVYYLRKRNNSTTALCKNKKEYFLGMPKQLEEIYDLSVKYKGYVSTFEKNIVLYHTFWHVLQVVNSPEKLFFMNEFEKEEYIRSIEKNLSYLDKQDILNFNLIPNQFNFFYKIGLLNCFKKEDAIYQIVYIDKLDYNNNGILVYYYTIDPENSEDILINCEMVQPSYTKIIQYDFLNRVFIYKKCIWIHSLSSSKNRLEIFINKKRAMITYGKYFLDFDFSKKKIQNNNIDEIWLFMDRENKADDNAEYLYRYIMQQYPKKKIIFALNKESSDWERLKRDGFSLVDSRSHEFVKIVRNSSKIISSHCDNILLNYKKPTQKFIFLQHGVIKDDLSRWLNSQNIDLFIVSTEKEYHSIVDDFTRYKFTKKEVVLTGLARHDYLLKRNKKIENKQIVIMPTWRKNLVNSDKKTSKDIFLQSEYLKRYNSLINNIQLEKLCRSFSYNLVFALHPNMLFFIDNFDIPKYIEIFDLNSRSMQELFCDSSLMITDYSSVAFDMAYLNKPVIYYQFEKNFFNFHSYQEGYFNYTRDGFGPVVESEKDLIKELTVFFEKKCQPYGLYKENINNTFKFRDGKCCERIYDKIKRI
ncbi:CDP-glycerol glycerophosphotransferase family protein [Campylobacter lari]|uniref:CDP-glycerol glycerophosphotransferase family protein n=1 Tax=Campylobacter lari TaxID=201 RepID=UPI0012826F53|nr:CDP-glycerol glycerophosphotransferase family protein [Campylobacter lari]EAJ5672662.1 glycosyltransferase [Campylobacter lari]EAK5889083.1 glycosyltransferase [Campylobacter lari]EGK8038358.1 glycosyltransferase [Campylobacter lari]MCH3687706.1 CDP-glycerol:glycerophosphate glycerophosphotransferase [Campylobacter lari]